MKLSVVIPTHNRPQNLRLTLEALGRQSLPREEFEIIVVDDGSRRDAAEQNRELCRTHHARLIEKPQGGLASARNRGAEEARGEFLYFLDDDVQAAPESCREILNSHAAAGEPVAVVGSLPYPETVKMNSFLWYMEESGHYDLYTHPEKYPGGVPPMPPMNGNSSISRALFAEIGSYDESFRQYGSEDLELGYRLAKAGVRFVYNPRAIGYHDHTKNFPEFCKDMETAGTSLIRVYRKYPDIKAAKKIDLVEDTYSELPPEKRKTKIIMELTIAFPWLLFAPWTVVTLLGPIYAARRLLFPCYRWIAYHHYAVGMRRGLEEKA